MLLMHKDIVVANVTNQMYVKRINKIYNYEHMPVGSYSEKSEQLSNIYYKKWLENRIIPNTRQKTDKIVEKIGRSVDQAFIESLGVSLTDSYWFKPENSNLEWNDVNFHDNGFDELSMTNFHHPDLTTNGVLEKEWICNNNIPILIKLNDDNLPLIANEIVASKIAELLKIPCVRYTYTTYQNNLACACESIITSGDYELVTALQIDHAKGTRSTFNFLRDNFSQDLDDMIFFHVLIRNTDGHHQNIALIRDTSTLQYQGLSPLYDNGTSLGSYRIANNEVSKIIQPTYDFKDFFTNIYEALVYLDNRILKYNLPKLDELKKIITDTYNIFGISEECTQIAIQTISESYQLILENQKKYSLSKDVQNIEQLDY